MQPRNDGKREKVERKPATLPRFHPMSLGHKARDWILRNIKPESKILEFGSGSTTKLLCKHFAHVTSVEHDAKWAKVHAGNHTMIHAPICTMKKESNHDPFPNQKVWYDRNVVQGAVREKHYDFILVDGPLRSIGRGGFWSCVDMFNVENACILVDDLLLKTDIETRVFSLLSKRLSKTHRSKIHAEPGKPGYHFGVLIPINK